MIMSTGKWIVLMGAPGCGKGTQAEWLISEAKFAVISVGELLRSNKSRSVTPDGKTIGDIIGTGALLPDEIVVDLVKAELKNIEIITTKNVLFDGFPRTPWQAEALAKVAKDEFGKDLDVVLNFVVEDDVITKRILGRYKCSKCGKIYNDFFLIPKKEGICDVCGCDQFDRRTDDNEESLKKRLSEYHNKTTALIDFYTKAGILKNINADADFETVKKSVQESLNLK